MTKMLSHNGCSSNEFGWLLEDVPKTSKFLEYATDNDTSTNFKLNKTNGRFSKNFRKTLGMFRFGCPRTPSPYKTRNKIIKIASAFSSTWPSPRLSHMIEIDDNEVDEHRYQFFKVATVLDNKLEDISCQTSDMQRHTKTLKQDYEELDDTANQLLTDVRHFISEIKDVRQMEDLITLLKGKTENISRQKWPFAMANSSPFSDLNLIV